MKKIKYILVLLVLIIMNLSNTNDWLCDVQIKDEYVPLSDSIDDSYTLNELKNMNVLEGEIIKTSGYFADNDGGAAEYRIVCNEGLNEDGFSLIALNNGLFAQLELSSITEINVAVAGIFSGNNISDKLNSMSNTLVNTECKKIIFNSGTYLIDKPIYLQSLTYIGTTDTVLSVSRNFYTKDDKIILTKPQYNGQTFNVNLHNITFLYETAYDHSMYNKETILVALQEISSCIVDNCKFISRPAQENGAFMKTDLLWFKHSNELRNIKVINSSFDNLTGLAYGGENSDHLIGGCIWICGKNEISSIIDNIVIENCNLRTTVSDEAIGIWCGQITNININNCLIENNVHNSDNLFSIYRASSHNINVNNCTFNINVPCMYITKFGKLVAASEINYNNCVFDIKCESSVSDAISVFWLLSDMDGYTYQQNSQLNVNGCTVIFRNENFFRTLVRVSDTNNKIVNLLDSKIDGFFKNGVIEAENASNNVFVCIGNDINTHSVLGSVKNAYNFILKVNGNQIRNKLTTTITNKGLVDYTFQDNTCLGNSNGAVFNANHLQQENVKSILRISNNKFIGNKKFLYYYSNDSLEQSSLLEIIN